MPHRLSTSQKVRLVELAAYIELAGRVVAMDSQGCPATVVRSLPDGGLPQQLPAVLRPNRAKVPRHKSE